MKRVIVDLAMVFALCAPLPARASGWEMFEDCHYLANQANDGDSFHVTCKGKEYLFRLYFVDTPETDTLVPERVTEQAHYFGLSEAQTLEVGKVASQFTRQKLTQPFAVRTRFQDALGRSQMQRFYAIVQTTSGDLAEQLIENGLARIHGTSANPAGLPSADVEWDKLQKLEHEAKAEKVGGWGANAGRMLVRSQKAQNRAATDPFDSFFHPNRAAATSYAPSPKSSFENFFHVATPTPAATVAIARSTSTFSVTTNSDKLDVNTATPAQLEQLPGIGEILAQRIIAARPFSSANDLRRVKGIGDTRYGKLRPYFR